MYILRSPSFDGLYRWCMLLVDNFVDLKFFCNRKQLEIHLDCLLYFVCYIIIIIVGCYFVFWPLNSYSCIGNGFLKGVPRAVSPVLCNWCSPVILEKYKVNILFTRFIL